MNPDVCAVAATAYASTARLTTPMENSAEDAPATRRSSRPPSQPTPSPMTVPPTSSKTAMMSSHHHGS